VEIEHLAQTDVDRADAAADRRRQRPLDRDPVGADLLDRLVGEPGVLAVDLVRLLAGVDLAPGDAAAPAVGAGDGGVEDAHRGLPDVGSGTVAPEEGDERVVGPREAARSARGDALPPPRGAELAGGGQGGVRYTRSGRLPPRRRREVLGSRARLLL